MKRILAAAFLLTAAGVATSSFAQSQAGSSYVFFGNPVNAALHFDGAEQRNDGTTVVRNVTVTIGSFVITADEATLEKTGFKLGANARLNLPEK